MELPRTKLPMVKNISIQDKRVVGVLDFSRSKDPFDTYKRESHKSPHLKFVRLGNDHAEIVEFIKSWGLLSRTAISDSKANAFLIPAILKLNHPIQREMPIPAMPFSLEFHAICKYRNQVGMLWDLWLALKAQDSNKMAAALENWSNINNQPLENLALKPYPLVSGPKSVKKANRLGLVELKACTAAAIARSFKYDFTNPLGTGGPFLCAEPIFYDIDNSIETMRMHYHIADLRAAMYCMILADITANKEYRTCKKCGKLFPSNRPKIFCSNACAQASASRTYYYSHGKSKYIKR
jgi:hypothetical protein